MHPGAPVAPDPDRAALIEGLERDHPRWRIWFDGAWRGRRKGNFLAPSEGARYFVSAPGYHEFKVSLAIEDAFAEPRGARLR